MVPEGCHHRALGFKYGSPLEGARLNMIPKIFQPKTHQGKVGSSLSAEFFSAMCDESMRNWASDFTLDLREVI